MYNCGVYMGYCSTCSVHGYKIDSVICRWYYLHVYMYGGPRALKKVVSDASCKQGDVDTVPEHAQCELYDQK